MNTRIRRTYTYLNMNLTILELISKQMTKPNWRAGHHRSYAQINPFPFRFYGPPHILPKSPKKALGKDLDGAGGA
jgi:hypothetical protein